MSKHRICCQFHFMIIKKLYNICVRKLQIAFPFMKQIHLDDVYVSIVAQKLNITLTNECRFANELERRTDVKYIMSSHNYGDRHHLYQAWRKINALRFS
jgi:undecaprenyl pyrophosphate synthase